MFDDHSLSILISFVLVSVGKVLGAVGANLVVRVSTAKLFTHFRKSANKVKRRGADHFCEELTRTSRMIRRERLAIR